jgi:hypothetical protein
LPQIDRFLARQPRLPLGLPAGQAQPFEFEAVAVDERTPHVQMELLLRNLEAGDVIDFVLNGSELDLAGAQRDTPRPGWIVIRVNRTLIQAGYNRLEIAVRTRDPAATDQLALADLMLRITSKPYDYRNDPSPPIASRPSPVTGALVITATDVQLPPGRVTAQRQWLLDELNGARPRVMSARAVMEHSANPDLPAQARFHVRTGMARQLNCPPDPAEQPLPGWHSLAVLFDADRMGADFQKQLAGVLAERVDRAMRRFAGPVVGTQSLAAIAVCAEVEQDLVRVADRFTDDAIPGSLPRPIRFLWAWDDGNLIARTFALILCDDTGCNAGESTVKDVPVRLGFMARRSTGEAGRTDDR